MKPLFSSTALSTGVLLTAMLTAPAARALADAAPAVSDSFEEVVVTAQKRTQNVQEVPLSVNVVNAQQLEAAGVVDFTDLGKVAPSLVIRNDVQPVNATVAIRGIGTFSFGIGVEPSVAVVVDDVPLAFQARAFSDLNDIARIETLSGPQSTLYGKSASAGLINIVTEAPSSTWAARVGAMGTTDSQRNFNGSITGPITNDLAFRLTANYDNFPGNVDNTPTDSKVNGERTLSLRGKLAWTPTDKLSVDVALDGMKSTTTEGRPYFEVSPNANLRGNKAYPPSVWAPGVTFNSDNLTTDENYQTSFRDQEFGQSAKIAYDLGGPTLMSITSHAYFALQDWQDSDDTAIPAYNNLQAGYFHNTQWTEELRLVSPGTGTFHYTAGFFYSDVTYKRDFQRGQAFSIANWLATEGSESEAGYGQFDYEFLPNLSFVGGLRVNNENIDMTFLDRTVKPGLTNYWAANKNDLSDTYKVGLQYQAMDDVMLFVTRATGHKGPTYDLTTGFNNNRYLNGPVLPETSTDYELGAKMQFFGHHLTVNPTLFTTDYSNFQAQGNQILPDGTTNFILSNVGVVRTQGAEIDSSYRFSHDFGLSANVNYLNAYIVSFPKAQCYANQTAAQGCVGNFQNLSDRALADAPRWKFTGAFDYAHPLGFIPWDGILRGSYTYQSKVNYALTLDPYTVQAGYGIANISFGIRDQDEKYELVGFVNNVGDQHYYSTIGDNSTNFGSGTVAIQGLVPRDFGRYAGVKLNAKF